MSGREKGRAISCGSTTSFCSSNSKSVGWRIDSALECLFIVDDSTSTMGVWHANTSFIPNQNAPTPMGYRVHAKRWFAAKKAYQDFLSPIGKESNSLEEVESGLIHSEPNVYTVYP